MVINSGLSHLLSVNLTMPFDCDNLVLKLILPCVSVKRPSSADLEEKGNPDQPFQFHQE